MSNSLNTKTKHINKKKAPTGANQNNKISQLGNLRNKLTKKLPTIQKCQ
jgi:hypothetical protein